MPEGDKYRGLFLHPGKLPGGQTESPGILPGRLGYLTRRRVMTDWSSAS
jgi:hypothetical protein